MVENLNAKAFVLISLLVGIYGWLWSGLGL